MGRRSINTTKSGKYMNPTDQARTYHFHFIMLYIYIIQRLIKLILNEIISIGSQYTFQWSVFTGKFW